MEAVLSVTELVLIVVGAAIGISMRRAFVVSDKAMAVAQEVKDELAEFKLDVSNDFLHKDDAERRFDNLDKKLDAIFKVLRGEKG